MRPFAWLIAALMLACGEEAQDPSSKSVDNPLGPRTARGGPCTAEGQSSDCVRECKAMNAHACVLLARMYESGHSIEVNPWKAFTLFNHACTLDDAEACLEVARRYERGVGDAAKDPEAARKFAGLSCNGNWMEGCVELALLAFEESPPDRARAKELLDRACKNGLRRACGIADAVADSRSAIEKACDDVKDNPGVEQVLCARLAEVLWAGDNGPKDQERAIITASKSCEVGYEKSCELASRWSGKRVDAKKPEVASASCTPACGEGFECTNGACVASTSCTPKCRRGYTCVDGQCVSDCNPPCGAGEVCGSDGECHALATAKEKPKSRRSERRSTEDNEREEPEPSTKDEKARPYQRSLGRLYGGAIAYFLGANGFVVPGGTLAFYMHPEEKRIFMIGARGGLMFANGVTYGYVGAEVGARWSFVERHKVAVGMMAAATPAAWIIATNGTTASAFHFGANVGPHFDFGWFTMQMPFGPAALVGPNNIVEGAFEFSFEIGNRF